MSITIELDRDAEERLRAQAAALGMPVEMYVAGIVREATNASSGDAMEAPPPTSLAEFEADMEALAEGLDHIPPLPPEAFTREAMYSNHD